MPKKSPAFRISLTPETSPGIKILVGNSSFVLVAVDPYVRKDGTHSWVASWAGSCKDCDEAYEVTTPLITGRPSSRCEQCVQNRKMGK